MSLTSVIESFSWPVGILPIPVPVVSGFVTNDAIFGFPVFGYGLKLLDSFFGATFDIASLLMVGSLAISLSLPINSTKSLMFALLHSVDLMMYTCLAHSRCSLSCNF